MKLSMYSSVFKFDGVSCTLGTNFQISTTELNWMNQSYRYINNVNKEENLTTNCTSEFMKLLSLIVASQEPSTTLHISIQSGAPLRGTI